MSGMRLTKRQVKRCIKPKGRGWEVDKHELLNMGGDTAEQHFNMKLMSIDLTFVQAAMLDWNINGTAKHLQH